MTPVEASSSTGDAGPSDPLAPPAHGREPQAGGATVLEALGISKRFGPTRALSDARLTIRPGEVHALLGENGAGKSTLIKILVGALHPDAGELRFGGQALELGTVGDAIGRGIVPVYQQLSLLPDLSIAENLFAFELAAGRPWRRARAGGRDEETRGALEVVGLDADPRTRVAELTLAQRQLVEIARAVVRDCRVLILDEPTTALGRGEITHLFAVVRGLRQAGRSVVFISHRLDEVAQIADRVTVLRNGATVVDGRPAEELSREQIVEAMAGAPVDLGGLQRGQTGDVVVRAEGIASPGAFADVDLEVRSGEILGVVGLIGGGAMELAETLAGARALSGGQVVLDGERLRCGDRAAALAAGVGYVPGDRDREGVFRTRTVLENATASALPRVSRYGILRARLERALVMPRLTELAVRPSDPGAAITALSGGNQQKVLVSRSLAAAKGRVLVVVEPTRGVDVAARHDIHRALLTAAAGGVAIVLASTDLDEVLALSHRVVVMRSGRVAAELAATGVTQEAILSQLTGAGA
ncbi:MAG: ribose transport system ATP-binding protein [Solirubrobacteraceae bacterium]|nr:ribose transport system ATP-binding protein [Solirubrobacteraceae bacterium]